MKRTSAGKKYILKIMQETGLPRSQVRQAYSEAMHSILTSDFIDEECYSRTKQILYENPLQFINKPHRPGSKVATLYELFEMVCPQYLKSIDTATLDVLSSAFDDEVRVAKNSAKKFFASHPDGKAQGVGVMPRYSLDEVRGSAEKTSAYIDEHIRYVGRSTGIWIPHPKEGRGVPAKIYGHITSHLIRK